MQSLGLDIKVLSENDEEIKLRESSEIEEPTDIRDIERKPLGHGGYEIDYDDRIDRHAAASRSHEEDSEEETEAAPEEADDTVSEDTASEDAVSGDTAAEDVAAAEDEALEDENPAAESGDDEGADTDEE